MEMKSYNIATINVCAISNPTKLNCLKTFMYNLDLDIVFLQEVFEDNLDIPGYTLIFNIDENKRGTAIAIKEYMNFSHVEKSLESRLISVRISNVTFCNLYAPSGSQNRARREAFFNETVAHYLSIATPFIILGGDFNAVARAKDATGSSNLSVSLQRLTHSVGLVDSWINQHGNHVEFSLVRANSCSRIDRIYVSENMKSWLRNTFYSPVAFSDHKAFVIRTVLPDLGQAPGRGFWRLQPHILDDIDVLTELRAKWQYWVRLKRHYTTWMEWWIGCAKPKISSFLKWKTGLFYRNFRDTNEIFYHQLQAAYRRLQDDPSERQTVQRLKAILISRQREHSQKLNAYKSTYIAGENTSTFHIAENGIKRRSSLIQSLVLEDGRRTTNSQEIHENITHYFREMYTAAPVGESQRFSPEKVIPENNAYNEFLMNDITSDEVCKAITRSCSKKSPGSDGLTKELYHKVWNIISHEFTLVINEALRGCFDRRFLDGVIVLVKKKGSNGRVAGYRPISLLNVDYKIFSRILKDRLTPILPTVLSNNQKCSNGKRNIFEATCSIFEKIGELKHKKQNSLLVSYDLDHAFDRVDRSFLLSTLEKMHFNNSFIQLLGKIMESSFSKVLVNGKLSTEIAIQRSVRQGDPLSMYLFVLYLQPLLDRLKTKTILLNAYADDITMFFTNERDLQTSIDIFLEFQQESGAVLNLNKTVALLIGNFNLTEGTSWLSIENCIQVLGLYLMDDIKQMVEKNWTEILKNFKKRLWWHKPRNLNLIQKTILVNTYVTSKLWYAASTIPLPNKYGALFVSEIGKFLWAGCQLRVAFENLVLPKKRGGLNLHSPTLKSQALLNNRILNHIDILPFTRDIIQGYLERQQSIPAYFSHLRQMISQTEDLPEQLRLSPFSSGIYSHFVEGLRDPPAVRRQEKRWKNIFTTLHCKDLSSGTRSAWFLILHRKIKHNRALFDQGRPGAQPFCLECPGVDETVEHKIFHCRKIRNIWTYQRSLLITAHPELRNHSEFDFVELDLASSPEETRIIITKHVGRYLAYASKCLTNVCIEDFKLFNEF